MLNLYFGEMPEAIYNTNVYFNNTYKDNWITRPLTRDMIKAVDKSEVIDEKNIMSPKRLQGYRQTSISLQPDHPITSYSYISIIREASADVLHW